MKLIMAIVQTLDADPTTKALNHAGYKVTKLGSTGGFFRQGNTILLCGVEDGVVEDALNIIRVTCQPRTRTIPLNIDPTDMMLAAGPVHEIEIGGATVFILAVESFLQI